MTRGVKLQTAHGVSKEGRRLARTLSLWLAPVVFLALILATQDVNKAAPLPRPQVTVRAGDDIMRLVSKNPPGTEFRIQPGVYRLQSITPRDGDAFIGEPGAILDGAELLKSFSHSGALWVAPVVIAERNDYRGVCTETHPLCKFPADLYFDGKPLLRVANLEDVGRGKWYLDHAAQTASLADDPTGHTVEIGFRSFAIRGDAANVRIEGLTIEKYGSEGGDGALDGRSASGHLGRGWVVQNNIVTLNHGAGIRLGDGMQVLRNKVLENGQLGIAGGGSNALVDGNEIAHNNYAGYKYDWEAGGTKFAFTQNLVVRNNYVHDNDGPGLWTDIENENTLYEHNRTSSNRAAGILHEISYRAIIRNNVVENDGFNGLPKTEPWYGAGIIVSASSDVEVYGNIVTNCMNGIVGTQPHRELSQRGTPYLLQNLNVHDNIITQSRGVAAGIVRSGLMSDEVFTSRNNRFTDNQFHLADSGANYFAWEDTLLSYREWKSERQE